MWLLHYWLLIAGRGNREESPSNYSSGAFWPEDFSQMSATQVSCCALDSGPSYSKIGQLCSLNKSFSRR